MIEYFFTVGQQILAMFLMVVVGYIMYKKNILSDTGINDMSSLLLKVVTPMILISAFQREFESQLFLKWLIMFSVSALAYFVQIILATIFYKDKSKPAAAESRLCITLPNNGFLAFPLMLALVGDLGIFLGSSNVILFNIIMWTYGVKQLSPHEKMSIRKIILNPGTVSVILGLLLFISPWKLPTPVFEAVDAIGALNTPVAMIILGGLLAQTDLKKGLTQFRFYKLSAIKLILVPIIMAVPLLLIPMPDDIRLIAFICSVTPSGTAISLIARLYDGDYRFSTSAIVITTVLSALTMPIILAVGKIMLGY